MTCKDCKYSQANGKLMYCRRYPVQTTTLPAYWCGEFKSKHGFTQTEDSK